MPDSYQREAAAALAARAKSRAIIRAAFVMGGTMMILVFTCALAGVNDGIGWSCILLPIASMLAVIFMSSWANYEASVSVTEALADGVCPHCRYPLLTQATEAARWCPECGAEWDDKPGPPLSGEP
ncbi:MAG TPA: hypothetical protein VD971_05155 [Phycisphaerales bacterium]|nr:hypothetical protein [Phycisphaerales bacterium]